MAAPAAPICSGITCAECTQDFSTKFNLKRHMIRKHEELTGINMDQNNQKENPNNPKENPNNPKENPNNPKENPNNPKENPKNLPNENQCKKCEKILSNKQNCKKHSKICKGKINPLECRYCNEVFTIPTAKYRHQKKCKEKELEKTTIINNNITNNICNNIQNQTNNINIQINNFGNENKDYITREFILKCLENGGHGVGAMVDRIYFDDAHPENHNVKLASLKHSYVEVKKDTDWIPQGLDTTLESMIRNASYDIICNSEAEEANENNVELYNSIQNLEPKLEKKIKDKSKSKLIARRKIK